MKERRLDDGGLLIEMSKAEQLQLRIDMAQAAVMGVLPSDPDVSRHQWELAESGRTVVYRRALQ